MQLIIDTLIEKIKKLQNPSIIGLDTDFDYLDDSVKKICKTNLDKCKAIFDYNKKIIDTIKHLIPAVKIQIAYYEFYGVYGVQVFCDTIKYAKSQGLIVVVDAKRGDIGATAKMYAKAFLHAGAEFECDFLTVNGYFGTDGLEPFVTECKNNNKGLFVLVKTSNPSGVELQNIKDENGEMVYHKMAKICDTLGSDTVGKYGYSNIGAVIGCQYGIEAKQIREKYKSLYMLVPGYGAQGGSASDAMMCFDNNGDGAIVNSSRGVLCAYKNPKYKGLNVYEAAKAAVIDMQIEFSKKSL